MIAVDSVVGSCDDKSSKNKYCCTGVECCQTTIPSALKIYNATIEIVNGDEDSQLETASMNSW